MKRGNTEFFVFCTEGPSISDCDFLGAQVAVMNKAEHPRTGVEKLIEQCVKNDENTHCIGSGTGILVRGAPPEGWRQP